MISKVEQIGLRTPKIRTRDNIITIVPNSYFIDDKVVNWIHLEEKTRFHMNVGVAYDSDVQLVKNVLLKVAERKKNSISQNAKKKTPIDGRSYEQQRNS